jgi:hypothetical protein
VGLFDRKTIDRQASTEPVSVPDEFAITGHDIGQSETLLAAYHEAARDLYAPDDSKVRDAIRAIAEAGSGLPLSSWMPLTMTGYQASDRAWRWLAACSRVAAAQGNGVVPIKMAMFAIIWTDSAPEPTAADPVELGLLRPPPEVLAEILARSIGAGECVPDDLLVCHFGEQLITAEFARRMHAHRLLRLEEAGMQVEPQAKALAIDLVS